MKTYDPFEGVLQAWALLSAMAIPIAFAFATVIYCAGISSTWGEYFGIAGFLWLALTMLSFPGAFLIAAEKW